MSSVRAAATTYTVSMLPFDHIDNDTFAITVEKRSEDLWAVIHHRTCLGTDGKWDYESIPSERTDEWLATHRFDLVTALRLAREAAPKIRVNGFTAQQIAARLD